MPRNNLLNTKCWTEFTISCGNGTFLIMTFMLFLSKYRFLNMPISEYIVRVSQMMYLIYIYVSLPSSSF